MATEDPYQTAIKGITDWAAAFTAGGSKTINTSHDKGHSGLDYVFRATAASGPFDVHIHFTHDGKASPAHIYQPGTSNRINDDEYRLTVFQKGAVVTYMKSVNDNILKTQYPDKWLALRVPILNEKMKDQLPFAKTGTTDKIFTFPTGAEITSVGGETLTVDEKKALATFLTSGGRSEVSLKTKYLGDLGCQKSADGNTLYDKSGQEIKVPAEDKTLLATYLGTVPVKASAMMEFSNFYGAKDGYYVHNNYQSDRGSIVGGPNSHYLSGGVNGGSDGSELMLPLVLILLFMIGIVCCAICSGVGAICFYFGRWSNLRNAPKVDIQDDGDENVPVCI